MNARKANKIYVLCNISQQYFWTVIQSNTDYNKTKQNIENIYIKLYIKYGLMYEKFGFRREFVLIWEEVEVRTK